MKRIHKYPLIRSEAQRIQLPKGSLILSVQIQRDTICLWTMCDYGAEIPTEPRTFSIIGTGIPIAEEIARKLVFIATIQDGDFVWHVFECL